jgi:glycosyltransferase involved in cell wall biosynthesis
MRVVLCYPFGQNRFEGGITQYCKKLEEYVSDNKNISIVKVSSNVIMRAKDSRGKISIRNIVNTLLYLIKIFQNSSANSLIYMHGSNGYALLKDLLIAFVLRNIFKRKVLLHIHYFEINGQLLSSQKLENVILTRLNLFADGFIVLGDGMRKYLKSKCPSANVNLHYNVSPMQRIERLNRFPQKTNLDLLFVGSLDERKRFFETLELFKELRAKIDIKLHVMGSFQNETYRLKCKRILDSLDDSVVMYGYVDDLAVKAKIYSDCDVLLLLSQNEGLPLVILEAMSRGLAIITTDVGAIPEVIDGGTDGVVLSSQDFKGDALEWITKFAMNSDILEGFKRSAWNKSKEFSVDKIFPRLILSLETCFYNKSNRL